MAIVFKAPKRISFYIITIIFIIVIAIFVWFILGRMPVQELDEIIEGVVTQRQEDVKIDFSTLENKLLEELEEFNPIIPTKEGYGRDNPFDPSE